MFGEASYSAFAPEKLIVGVSGQYNDMVSRPFQMHTAQNTLDELMLKTQNGLNITQQTVQLDGQSVIQISAEGQGVIEVDGGWQSGRNVVVLVLRNIHDGSKFVMTGYTDPDFLYNEQINQYSRVTFDSVIELQAIQQFDGSVSYQLYNSDNILSMTHLNGRVGGQQISTTQRPVDVLDNASFRQETMDNSDANIGGDTPIVHLGMADSMGMGNRNPELSRASNGSANDYLFRTSRAFADTRLTASSQDDLSHNLAGAASNEIISEGSYTEMPLLNTLLTHASARRAASATVEDLMQVMPNLMQVAEVIRGDTGAVLSNVEHWQGRGDTKVAAEFAAAIPAIMLKLGIQLAGFQMSSTVAGTSMDGYNNTFNYKLNPMDQSMPLVGFVIPEIPQQQMLSAFQAYMRSVVFPSIAQGRNVIIDVECSITKDFIISISVDGCNPLNFSAPTFASSAWSPVGSTTLQSNTSMSNGMLELTSYMTNMQEGNVSPSSPLSGNQQITQNQPNQPVQMDDDGLF